MIITAFGTVETAVEAMKLGAFDFLIKPFAPEVVRLKVERALELRAARRAKGRLDAENAYLRGERVATLRRAGRRLRGDAQGLRRRRAGRADATPRWSSTANRAPARSWWRAPSTSAASARRGRSSRSTAARSPRRCSRSELFGHEKGAFTGAIKRKLGRFELADGGTLFLDEIGEISPAMQVKLLRVLQEREFERVGGETQRSRSTCASSSATNRDLAKRSPRSRFREDLYLSLAGRADRDAAAARAQERHPAAGRALHRQARRRKTNPARGRHRATRRWRGSCAYRWPGNVRELENVIEQALVFADGERIAPESLPLALRGDLGERPSASGDALPVPSGEMSLPDILDDLERQLILKAYTQAKGVKTETARLLGIKTSALYYKLEKYGIG